MRLVPALPRPVHADAWGAVAAVCLLGVGSVAGIGGALSGSPALMLIGGGAAAAALTLLLAAGWLPPLAVLALSLPLPALYDTGSLRVSAAAVVTLLVLYAWALGRGAAREPVRLERLPRRSTAALFGAILLAALFAESHAAAARELVNFGLLLGLLVVATDLLAADRRRLHTLAITIAAVAGGAGVLALFQALGALPGAFELAGTSFHRATLGFGWPNELGVFFAVSLPLCWYALRSARTPGGGIAAGAALVGAGLGLVATFSRGSWLAFLLSGAILILAGEARLVVRIAVGVLVGAALVDLAAGGVVATRMLSLADDPYVVQRAALMLVGLLMFRANPIVGVGPGGFREQLEEYGPNVSWLWDYVGSAHNAYIEMAAETGLIGVLAFLSFLGAVLVVLIRAVRHSGTGREALLLRALLWSFAAACLAGFTAWPFAHGIGQLIMLVVAMAVVAATQGDGAERTDGASP